MGFPGLAVSEARLLSQLGPSLQEVARAGSLRIQWGEDLLNEAFLVLSSEGAVHFLQLVVDLADDQLVADDESVLLGPKPEQVEHVHHVHEDEGELAHHGDPGAVHFHLQARLERLEEEGLRNAESVNCFGGHDPAVEPLGIVGHGDPEVHEVDMPVRYHAEELEETPPGSYLWQVKHHSSKKSSEEEDNWCPQSIMPAFVNLNKQSTEMLLESLNLHIVELFLDEGGKDEWEENACNQDGN